MSDEARLESIRIGFASGAVPAGGVELRGVVGREQISRLFEFDLLLSRPKPFTDDELDKLLASPCAVALGPKPGDVVHGILERIELIDSARTAHARYLARLVPMAWLMTLTRSCRVYQNATVPEMAAKVLELYGLVRGKNFDLRVQKPGPKHEYVVQYQESDWAFLQRWLEHQGLFYWFVHDKGGERLVVADENEDATPIDDPSMLSYRERNNLSAGGRPTIWDWNLVQRRIPARVAVLDYNYRTPHMMMTAKADVDTKRGFGSVFYYGEHFKDTDEGKWIAERRAERLLCDRRTYRGRTDCARFRVGHVFEMENHHDVAHDGKYLVTSIEHRVGYPILPDGEDLGEAPQRYFARFEAVPIEVAYRPERITPWPRIDGVLNAHVDADSGGDVAQIDELGRYRVKLPFDSADAKGSKASRWIRMAQPYAGAGYGAHHPLHKGTEVLLAHVDGDPDRPIIVGSVPNPHTPSPSTSRNATQSVVQTASGIRVEMEDQQG